MIKLKILADYLFSTGVIAAPIAGVGYLYVDQKNISWKDIVSFLKQQQELIKEEEKQDDSDAAIADIPQLPPPVPSTDEDDDSEEEQALEEDTNVPPPAATDNDEKKAKGGDDSSKKKKQKPIIKKDQIMKIIDKLISDWTEKKQQEKDTNKQTKIEKGINAFKTIKNALDQYQDADPSDDISNVQAQITT